MRVISVGVLLVLLVGLSRAGASSTPSAAVFVPIVTQREGGVVLRSTTAYTDGEDLVLVGEFANYTSRVITSSRIAIRWYDAQGALLLRTDTYPVFFVTDPGQVTPFGARLSNPPAAIASHTVTLTWAVASGSDATYRHAVTVTAQERDADRVRGTVRNDLDRTISVVQVAATCYDAHDNVTAVTSSYADSSSLDPGDIVRYDVRLSPGRCDGRVVVQARDD